MLYFGVKERKKLVVVCALLEHEIIMTIPAVAELVVEFQVVYKFLNTPRQDPVHSWKAGPGEVMTVGKKDKTRQITHLLDKTGFELLNMI